MAQSVFTTPIIRSIDARGITSEGLFQLVKGPFLFDGSVGGWFDGLYSLIGLSSFAVFQSKKNTASFEFTNHSGEIEKIAYRDTDPLSLLQRYLNRFRPVINHAPLAKEQSFPFWYGGAVGFIGYDLIQQFEPVPPHREEHDLPDIYMAFINHFILLDHAQRIAHIVYHPAPLMELGWNQEDAYRTGYQSIDAIRIVIEKGEGSDRYARTPFFLMEENTREPTFQNRLVMTAPSRGGYIEMVEKAKEYIAAGDIFQANLAHRFSVPYSGRSIFPLYQCLRSINPSPFSAYLNMGGIEMAGVSPERLIRTKKEGEKYYIETKPIAGTRPRGQTKEEDRQQVAELYDSEKERAEHLMLVDLERNDIGKVARIGTVQVDALLTLSQYSHVSHLVSNITGVLRESVEATDALRALFPGGTVTGVPKIRCMQIIAELENQARGLYTGSVGYFDFLGEMDMNIVIRTFVRQGNTLHFHVGAGIVADSNPEMEYQETRHKAAALLDALKTLPPQFRYGGS